MQTQFNEIGKHSTMQKQSKYLCKGRKPFKPLTLEHKQNTAFPYSVIKYPQLIHKERITQSKVKMQQKQSEAVI